MRQTTKLLKRADYARTSGPAAGPTQRVDVNVGESCDYTQRAQVQKCLLSRTSPPSRAKQTKIMRRPGRGISRSCGVGGRAKRRCVAVIRVLCAATRRVPGNHIRITCVVRQCPERFESGCSLDIITAKESGRHAPQSRSRCRLLPAWRSTPATQDPTSRRILRRHCMARMARTPPQPARNWEHAIGSTQCNWARKLHSWGVLLGAGVKRIGARGAVCLDVTSRRAGHLRSASAPGSGLGSRVPRHYCHWPAGGWGHRD